MFTHVAKEFREQIQCDFCDSTFTRSESLKNHMKTEHETPVMLQCFCGKQFNLKVSENFKVWSLLTFSSSAQAQHARQTNPQQCPRSCLPHRLMPEALFHTERAQSAHNEGSLARLCQHDCLLLWNLWQAILERKEPPLTQEIPSGAGVSMHIWELQEGLHHETSAEQSREDSHWPEGLHVPSLREELFFG